MEGGVRRRKHSLNRTPYDIKLGQTDLDNDQKTKGDNVMSLFSSLTITYNVANGGNVDGVKLKFNQAITVLGVDSKKPDDPSTSYSLKGDGSTDIEITKISKNPGNNLTLRLRSTSTTFPSLVSGQSKWTRTRATLG